MITILASAVRFKLFQFGEVCILSFISQARAEGKRERRGGGKGEGKQKNAYRSQTSAQVSHQSSSQPSMVSSSVAPETQFGTPPGQRA